MVSESRLRELIEPTEAIEYDLETELAVLQQLDTLLDSDSVFWDIGAHAGMYSVVAAELYPAADIYCFEPSENTRETKLQPTIEAYDNITVIPYALAEEDTTKTYLEAGKTCNSLQETSFNPDEYESIEIDVYTAETIHEQYDVPNPDVVKVDVEGAEYNVVQGFSEEQLQQLSHAIIELHHINTTDTDTKPYLQENGFSIVHLSQREKGVDRRMEHIQATNNSL